MTRFKNSFEIYALLPKTNCGECGAAICLAFAAAVLKEEKQSSDCPRLDEATLARLGDAISKQVNIESIRDEQLKELKEKIAKQDIVSRARLLGATSNGKSVTIRCLGKDFKVDAQGAVASQCHTHAWFTLPLLVCYWRSEDGMESQLHLFFDDTAERILPVESLFTMATGIVRMLERIMYRHTDGKSELA